MERVKIEKMVFGGQGMGHLSDGRVVFVWNALPGEEVDVEITKKKSGYREGIARTIHTPSVDRVEPREVGSYLSTSPWQMMTFEAEQRYKLDTAKEAFLRTGGFDVGDMQIIGREETMYGYRNKMEFSFYTVDRDSPIELCFYGRGTHQKVPVPGSELAEPVINVVAQGIRDWLNAQGVNRIHLKSLIVRSNGQGEAIAALFVKEPIEVEDYPEIDGLVGFQLYFSDPKSPASVPTELLYRQGADTLTASIGGCALQFGLLSFFQVNQVQFEHALKDIAAFIGAEQTLVDFYSGVGSIGIPLAKNARGVTLVEINEEANVFARHNVKANRCEQVTVVESSARRALEWIDGKKMLILDPPRAGLHGDVVERILEARPPKIAYLSCNISTQARDVALLLETYRLVNATLYNFFPRTPHTESLLLLERR